MTKSEGSTIPSPDKLEIPEAAVEAMLDERARWGDGFTSRGPRYFVYRRDDDDDDIEISAHPDRATMEAAFALASARAMLLAALPHMPDRGYADAIRTLAAISPADNGEVRMPHTGMTANEAARFIDSVTPSPIEDVAEPSESEALDEDRILDVISGNLRMESWVAGKTLTVMFDAASGERRFAKLRLTNITAQPSPADLKGEPE